MAVNWISLPGLTLGAENFAAPWRMVIDFIEDVNILRIAAEGEWEAWPGVAPRCGPDGFAGLAPDPKELILPTCLIGALIGKLGGSSAGLDAPAPAPEGKPPISSGAFAIGTGCLVTIPAGTHGPLFIGINSRARPIALTGLRLQVWGGTIAQP